MRHLQLIFLGFVLVTSSVTYPFFAHAQSAIEKAFVAKSKLANKIWERHDASSAIEIDHSAWSAFLGKYVQQDGAGINRLAYASVSTADKSALKNYLKSLQATDVTKLNRDEQYAFWLNLYNASIVNLGIENYPVKSILDIKSNLLDVKGPFNDPIATVNGQTLTPDTIESGIVRPIWNDPNLHYGFNCAAISCPNLLKSAFRGDSVHEQLDKAATAFINNPRGVTLEDGKLILSKIYFWYSEDFGGEKGVLKHVSSYANDSTKSMLSSRSKVDRYEYDWALNRR